jgi:hypothetical protein
MLSIEPHRDRMKETMKPVRKIGKTIKEER